MAAADGGYFQEPANGSDSTGKYGATVARLTSDQKVGSSNLSAFILLEFLGSRACPDYRQIACDVKGLLRELNPGPLAP